MVMAGARFERYVGSTAASLERRLFACAAPQHRLLPRLLTLLLCPPQDNVPVVISTTEYGESMIAIDWFIYNSAVSLVGFGIQFTENTVLN